MADNLKRTPLFESHVKLRARLVPFAGYEMPVQYSGLLNEATTVRTQMGLFDVSHMGQFSLRGKNSLEALQKLVTNDLTKIQFGQAQYNMLCNESGGVLDDLVVYRRSEEETFICVNASNRLKDFAWMREHLPSSLTLVDESDETGLIALQGPKSEALLCALADPKVVTSLKYYWAVEASVAGIPVYLSRTGYTGEDGFELYVAGAQTAKLWETLLEKGQKDGLIPCGLGARDTLRLEMGYPLHGHEISETISPLSAGLSWVVKLQKATAFIGQKALIEEAQNGSPQLLKAFVIQDRRIARQGYRILSTEEKPVGTITSGTFSPHVQAPIALGFVDAANASDALFHVEVRDARIPAKVVKLPFIPPHTKRVAKV